MRVTVVGAGVIGLSTALALEEAGHEVRVVAEARGEGTTSAIAGAVWLPYKVGPKEKVAAWSMRTRAWLLSVAAAHPEAGVDALTGYVVSADGRPPWWAEGEAVAPAEVPLPGAPSGFRFDAPRAEPAAFLPWLESRLRGEVELRRVADLYAEPGDVVVNCTGLGARELVGDAALVPLFGQIVVAEPGSADLAIALTDEREEGAIFYVIPRRGEVVLGGCSLPWPMEGSLAPDPAIGERILAQCRERGIGAGDVRRVKVGLRPFRPEVRLEKDPEHPRVIHNYGHGGAGFTLCRGCAEDVARLLARDDRSS